MKNLLLIVLIIPALSFAQTRKQRKAQAKADTLTITNLRTHIQWLASDKLEGRRTGTAGELLAMQYIAVQFEKTGLTPKGTNGFIQEFEINEGKQLAETDNFFSVNGQKLELKKDYFPLAYSANIAADGSSSLGLRENGSPWFFDLKDVLDENKSNPHFDINDAINAEAKRTKEKGGNALVVFNSSATTDNVQFNKNDSSAAASLPILYLTKDAMQHFFADATGVYDLKMQVSLAHAIRKAHNVVGYLNFNAPTTVIIGAHYDHLGYGEDANSLDGQGQIHNGADDNASGTAALMEMARLLQQTKAHNNNYLFIAFSGEELGLFGSKYWLEKPSANIVPNYMINMDMVGRYDSSKKLTIGGYGTSPVWAVFLQQRLIQTLL